MPHERAADAAWGAVWQALINGEPPGCPPKVASRSPRAAAYGREFCPRGIRRWIMTRHLDAWIWLCFGIPAAYTVAWAVNFYSTPWPPDVRPYYAYYDPHGGRQLPFLDVSFGNPKWYYNHVHPISPFVLGLAVVASGGVLVPLHWQAMDGTHHHRPLAETVWFVSAIMLAGALVILAGERFLRGPLTPRPGVSCLGYVYALAIAMGAAWYCGERILGEAKRRRGCVLNKFAWMVTIAVASYTVLWMLLF